MKGVELFVIVLVVATALGAIGYMIAPSGISGLQTFNSPPSQNFGSLLVESTPSALNLDDVFFDSDGETLTYAVDDSAVVLNGNTLAFSAPANFAGDYTITITVSDGTNTIAKPFTFILPASEAQTAPAASPASTQEETRGTLQEQPIELVSTESQISDVGRETSSGKSISAACTDCTDCTTCAATPGNTCTLSANIDSTDTCITVPASGVTIDCAGFNITYASTTDNSFGIDTAGVSNTIITGCNITQTSGTFQASPAINLGTSGGGFQVLNSRIITPGTGISGSGITSLIVQNTNFNLSTGASGFSTVGVDASGTNIIIRNNSFSATGNGIGIESFGSTLVNISNNTFSIAGVTPGNALELNINHSNVTGNRMIATTSNSNFNGQNVTVTDNRFRSLNWVTGTNFTWRNNRASSTGEHVFDPRTGNATSMNDTFTGRLVLRSINFTMHNSTFNSTSIGVLRVAGINITIENATARASGGIHLIGVNGSGHILSNITIQATATPLLNLTNTTNSTFTNLNLSTTSTWISFIGTITDNRFFNINMSTSNGSIFYPEFNVSTTGILNRTNVTITLNQTFVNTTGLSFLNQSAQIQLRNLTFTDPLILIDTNDDGVYATCAEPDCTEISYNGSTIVFNVSHFTSHAISEGANAHPTIAQVILNSSDGSGETSNTSANGENLTVVIVNATDADNDAVQNITDWRVNGTSIAVLNMPFETNSSNLSTGAIRDYSQFGKNGTLGNGILASAPAWNYSDKVGGSYVFDGTDDFINTSFNDPIVNGVWTITAWIKHNQTITSDGGHLFEMSDGSTCLNDCILARVLETNGNFILVARSQAGETVARQTNRSVNDSQWHHIAMVVDVAGDSMQLYVDGLLNQSAQTGTFASTIDANRNLIIGRRENPLAGTDEFTGSIDEFIIFNRSLSAAQIYQLYLDGNNSRHMETLHADETGLADVWSVAVTPNDNQNASDGTTVISNNVTILADNTHPSIQQVILNNSNGAGYNLNISNTSSNLTVFVINATDANNDSVQNITDWRINGASIAVLNLPFETNFSSNTVDAVRDYSTFGNNGTLGNGSASAVPIWNSSGKAGGAYTFDGTDDYIDCGVSGFPSTVPLTLEAWAYFNQDQGATDFDYVIQASGFDNTDVFIIARQATTNNVYYFENNAVRTGPALSTGSWNHVVMVFRATAPYVLFYLNGTNQTITQPVGGALTPTGGILCELGRFSGGSHFLNGSLDEVKIYNYELPAEQVYQNYLDGNLSRHVENIMSVELTAGENWSVAVTPNDQRNASDGITVLSNNVTILADPLFSGTPALNGSQFGNTSPENLTANLTVTSGVKTFTNWYVSDANVNNKSLLLVNMPMDGGTLASGKVRDYSPNDNHATPVGVVYTSTGGYDGRGAYTFDGSDGLTFPTNITFGQQDNWTVAFWAQRTADDARGGIFGKQRGVTTDTIWLLGDIIEFRNNTVGTDVAELQYSFDPNTTRQHYAFVANNHRLELYVNGTFFQAIDAGTGFTFDGMGEFFTSSFDFAGTADDLLVWNASLTPSQIYAIYSGNTTRLHSAMTRVGETLLSQVTPNNNIIDDTTQYSNNITIGTGDIFGRNQTYINSSSSTNTSTENITLNVTYATNVSQVYSYIRNGSPILAAYYTFNTEEEVMRDYSGSNRTGQRRRLVTWQPTSGRDGKGVMNFAGSDDSLTIPPMTWNPRQPWSVSFWAQKSADNDQGAAIGARDSVTDVIWIQSTLLEFRNSTDGGGGNSFAWDANTSRNFYTLVAPGTDRLDLYVNGTYFNSLDVGTGFIINDAGDSVLGFSFGGTLDDIAIWNTTLTPSQIRALFNNRSDVVVNSMTGVSDVWQMRTIPGDNFSDGDTTTLSMTVLDGDSYGFSAATLSGLSSNSTNENLTATFSYASTVDKNVVWYVNSSSTQLLNLPFDTEAFQTRDYAANQSYNRFSHVIWEPTAGVDGRGQLHFQGSNDYISVPQTTLTGTQPWTITVWAQKDLDGSNGGFVGTTNGVTDFISIRSTDVEFRNSTVGGGGPTFAFDANTSRHFYAFRAGGNGSLELFVNGSRIGAVTMGTNFTINNIGAAVTGTAEDFDGTLDEFILWNRSLSQEQIQALYAGNNTLLVSQETQTGDTWQACEVPTDGIDDGQVRCTNAVTIADANNTHPTIAQVILNNSNGAAYNLNISNSSSDLTAFIINATDADNQSVQNITDWRVNGSSIAVLNMPFETNVSVTTTGSIRDYSTSLNNGTVGNGTVGTEPVWTSGGRVGGAYDFDGINDQVYLGNPARLFTQNESLTVSVWALNQNTTPFTYLISRAENVNKDFALYQYQNGSFEASVFDGAGTSQALCTTPLVAMNQFHHFVYVYDNGTGRCYVDGVSLANSSVFSGNRAGNTNIHAYIGARSFGAGSTTFDGFIDEVLILNRSLSTQQVYQWYLDGNSTNHTQTIVSQETTTGDIWSVAVTPNDNQNASDGTTVLSNNVTILADPNNHPVIAQVILNSTDGSGETGNTSSTTENLVVVVINATDADNDSVQNITDWRVNGTSLAVLNAPFETNISLNTSSAIGDYSTFANNGSLGNGSSLTTLPVWNSSGRAGGAYTFDGTDDVISFSDPSALDFLGGFSLETWVRTTQTLGAVNYAAIAGKGHLQSGVNGYGLFLNGDANTNVTFQTRNDVTVVQVVGTSVNDGNWHQVVGVRDHDGNTTYLYVDGVLVGSAAGALANYSSDTHFAVGARHSTGSLPLPYAWFYSGTIDEVRAYNRTLTAEQIYQLYLDGNNSKHLETLVSDELSVGDIWSVAATPNDNQNASDGTTVLSNNVTILADNTHPTIAQVILNSTDGSGAAGNNATTNESLTVLVINATDADSDFIQNITDWRLNGASITVLNLPFETNSTNLSLGGIRDYSLAGNNGWLGGGVSANASNWTLGQIGGAYSFDGAVDVLVVPSSSSFAFGSVQDYSWEAWVNLGSYPPASHGGVIIEKHNLSSSVTLQAGVVSNGKVSLGVRDTALVVVGPQSAAPISLGSWHHVVATANRDQNLSLYIDGVLSNSTSMAGVGNVTSGVNISIGNTVYTGGFWQGLNATIDEVRIYNRSLSAEQVAQLYQDGLAGLHMTTLVNNEISADDVWTVAVTPNDNQNASDGTTVLSNAVTILELPPSVILNSSDGSGYAGNNASDNENLTVFVTDFGNVKNITDWMVNSRSIAVLNMPFEGGSNSTFTRDYSTFGNNGQVLGPTWNQTGGFDSFGAYEFDGVNDYVELGNRTSLDGRGPTSISAWVKTTGINGDIVSKFGDADLNDSYVLRVNSAGQAMFSVSSSGFKSANSVSVINNGQYHHVMGVFTGSAIQIYVNGTLENTTAASGTIDASNATVKIGRGGFNVTGFGGEYFNGTIDEVMIFNRSFSTTQVSQYYSDLLTYRTLTTIVSDQTLAGQAWTVNVTTNNGTADTGSNTSNSVTILGSIVSGTKTDSADPVSNGQTFTYQINTTITNSTAYNVTVIESYPAGLSFVSSQPTPTSGNNVFALGDLSNTTFSVNVTVQVTTGVTQGYGNVVNISYNDADGYNYSQIVTQSTAYISIVTCSSCVACTSCLTNTGAYCRATNAITAGGSCVNMTASNTTFDCNGFELNFGTGGGTRTVGINATNINNILIKNCFVRDTSALGAHGVGINFTNVDNSRIENNTVFTNGTTGNYGIGIGNSSTNNTVFNNTVVARGTGISNTAVYLLNGANNTVIRQNMLTAIAVTSGAFGIRLESGTFNVTILNNSVLTMGAGVSNYGVSFESGASSSNNTVNYNSIRTNGSAGVSNHVGIRLISSYNNSVTNNVIQTNGGSTNYGITITSTPCDNNTFINNTIRSNGTSTNNDGIRLISACGNTLVDSNTITTYGTAANLGIGSFVGHSNTTIRNNVVFSSGSTDQNQAISIADGSNFSITNNTLRTNGTSSNHGIFIVRSNHSVVDNNSVITQGTGANSVGIGLNTDLRNHTISRNVVRTNGTSSNFGIELTTRVNNNTIHSNIVYTNGTSDNRGINNIEQSHNNIIYNNTVFTSGSAGSNYGIAQSDANNATTFNNTVVTFGTGDDEVMFVQRSNDSAVYNNFFTSTGTGGTNVGLWILNNAHRNNATNNTINTTGTTGNNHGLYLLNNVDNARVENNTIYTNGTNANNGIRIETNGDNNVIRNNTVTTNGTEDNHGVIVGGATVTNNLVEYNTVRTNTIDLTSSGGFGVGIYLAGSPATNTTVQHNRVFTAGGPFSWGIAMDGSVSSLIYNNTVSTNGTSQNMGIRLDFGAENNTVRGNNVTTDGSSTNNFGLSVTRSFNTTLENNVVLTYSSLSNGLRVASFSNNTYFVNNTVSTRGTNSYGIAVGVTAGGGGSGGGGANQNFFTDTRLVNVSQWISVIGSNTTNFTNTTFENLNGSINFPANFSLNGTMNVTRTELNVLNNTVFINTTNVSQLNTSATITLNGLNASTPRLIVDYNDDLLAEYCDSPQCALSSYNGSTLVFNVSSFTSYSSSGNMSVDKNDTPDPVTAGAQLNYTITIVNEGNDTLINTTAVETYPSDVAFDSSSPTPDVGNNTWFLGNLTNGTVTTINITVNVSSATANGTVINNSVNVTFANNEGINVSTVDLENTTVIAAAGCPIDVSVSTTLASDITCPATAINILADNVLLDCSGYHITYAVNSSGYGINATSRTNVTIANCNLQAGNVSDSTSAGLAFDTTTNSRAYNITAFANASRSVLLSSATANNLSNMSLVTNGTAVLASGSTGNIFDNMSITPGAFGYSMATGGNNTVIRNIIDARRNGASGALLTDNNEQFLSNIIYANGRGIFFSSATQGLAQNNTVITNSSSAIELSSSTNIIVDNNTLNTTIFNPAFFMQSSSQNNITNNFGRSDSGSFGQQFSTNNLYDNNQGPNFLFIVNSPSNRATNNNVSNIQLGNGNYNNLTNNRVNFVQLSSGSSNNTFDLTTINSTTSWITSDSTSFDNNWTRTNLTNADGAVYFPLQFIMPSAAVANPHMILSTNLTRVNSTNLSFLNATAQILFNSLLFVDPRPVVDLEDDGTFLDCNPPTCAEISYAGGVFVFNVSSFTSYAAQENLTFVINLSADKIDSPDPVARGSQLSYQIVLNNSGNGTARNVTVFESYSSGVVFVSGQPTPSGNDTFSVGDIAPGGTFIVNITVNVSSALVNGTVLNNTVNVTFANSSGENSSFNESELTTVLGAPVLVSIKSDTPDPVVRGSTLNYSILINNTGDDTAFNVTLSETYPAGVSFVTAQPTPTGNNTFAIGTLAPNETFVVNITVTVGSNVANGTLLNNSVNASWRNISGQQGTVSDSETTTVLGIAALTVVKTDTPDPVNNGSVLSYTITVTNTGDETAYNVTAVDGYDVNITFNGSSPTPFSGNDTFALGDLLPGMSTTINITVNVSANMTSGVLNNTVNVTFTNASGVNETTSAFQATTVTTPAVPAAPSGGGGGGGSNFFRNANVTREQPVQAVPVALPTVAPQIQRPEQLEQPRPTVAQNTTVQEPVHTTSIEPTAATTQVDTLKQQNNINKMASFALGALIFIAVFMLLLLLAHRNAKPATVAQSGRIVLKTDLPKTQAQPKPAAKPTTKSARIAKAQKTPPKPAAVKPSEPKKSTPPAHDLKKLSADIEKINTMLRTFDKKLKK